MSEYARRVRIASERVLTQSFREALGTMSSAQLASLILGYEAGAVLAIEPHAGMWIRRSNFSQLCGRAILHSVPFYGSEYSVDERMKIRRALIYGSRMSVFAPVRLPLDFTLPARAARQWVELLMACPHELEQVADEVEQVALVYEAQEAWGKAFFETISAMPDDLRNDIFATHSNLFLIPLARVISIFRRVVSVEVIRRLETLGNLIHQRGRLQSLAQVGEEGGDKSSRVLESKTPPPLTVSEVKELSKEHEVSLEDLRDWSALRVVLTSYGWLARRVGDYTVPQNSLIFVIMKEIVPHPESNARGLVGRKAMVGFRATRLAERWGKSWTSLFCEMDSARMAESLERYEKLLMSGTDESPETGELGSGGNVVAGGKVTMARQYENTDFELEREDKRRRSLLTSGLTSLGALGLAASPLLAGMDPNMLFGLGLVPGLALAGTSSLYAKHLWLERERVLESSKRGGKKVLGQPPRRDSIEAALTDARARGRT